MKELVTRKRKENLELTNSIPDNINKELCIISVGNDGGCHSYIKIKTECAKKYGIKVNHICYGKPNDISELSIIYNRIKFNIRENAKEGIPTMLQYPLEGMRTVEHELASLLQLELDVDGINPKYSMSARLSKDIMAPCTAMSLIEGADLYADIYNEPKKVLVIGRSTIVGKPVVDCLITETDCSVMVTNSKTPISELEEMIKMADILIATSSNMLEFDYSLLAGKIVLDSGFIMVDGKISGCIPTEAKKKYCKEFNTPTGTVGPLTVEFLMGNVLTHYNTMCR